MKFLIKGIVKKNSNSSFSMETEANSEKHAKELVLVKLGSRHGAKKTQIKIQSIEKVK
jgi:ribosomal protein L20A (L18A)